MIDFPIGESGLPVAAQLHSFLVRKTHIVRADDVICPPAFVLVSKANQDSDGQQRTAKATQYYSTTDGSLWIECEQEN